MEKQKVKIVLVEARDLPKVDIIGTCDAYAIASVGPNQQFKTRVAWNSLLATWNQAFEFEFGGRHGDLLLLQLFDKDLITRDDFIGSAELRLSDIFEGVETSSLITKELTLVNQFGNVHGQSGLLTTIVVHVSLLSDTPSIVSPIAMARRFSATPVGFLSEPRCDACPINDRCNRQR